ncbi:hypothetical protein TNCV_1734731 [Trichonephila clavipes]|nr:hypothetical protein TNCV_1734731 [Trichonephila clavipes]
MTFRSFCFGASRQKPSAAWHGQGVGGYSGRGGFSAPQLMTYQPRVQNLGYRGHLMPLKICRMEWLMCVKSAQVRNLHVGVMWKFAEHCDSSGVVLVIC